MEVLLDPSCLSTGESTERKQREAHIRITSNKSFELRIFLCLSSDAQIYLPTTWRGGGKNVNVKLQIYLLFIVSFFFHGSTVEQKDKACGTDIQGALLFSWFSN